MKLLTKNTAEKNRCFPLSDGSKVWGRMLTATEVRNIRADVRSESGTDEDKMEHLFKVQYLQKAASNWEGFTDEDETPIPFDTAIIPDLFEVNPVIMGVLFGMVSSEFIHLAQAEEKNSETGATDK